jgi:hypothetical protein
MKPRARTLKVLGITAAALGFAFLVAVFSGLGSATVTFGDAGTSRDAAKVRLDGWPVLGDERVSVYREPSLDEELAREALARLRAVDRVLSEVLPTLPRGHIGMVLLPAERYDADALYLPGVEVWPLTVALEGGARDLESDAAKDFFFQLIPHEWIEAPIGNRLYWRDRSMRWYGDGLAEYAAFVTSATLESAAACARFERYLELFSEGETGSYDLTRFSVATLGELRALAEAGTEADERQLGRGYAASFALFYRLAQLHDEAQFAAFVERSLGWLWPAGGRVRAEVEGVLREDSAGEEGFTDFTGVPHAWIVGQIREARQQNCTG